MDDFAPLDGPTSKPPQNPISQGDVNEWQAITPVPDDAPAPPQAHRSRGLPSKVWTYRDAQGGVMFYVFRFDNKDGGKDIIPLSFYQRKSDRGWRWKGLPVPRPLYNLNLLDAQKMLPVLIVEGEKAADAATNLFNDYTITTWPNGSKAVGKTDWKPLAGRDVVLWPDTDEPGTKAMANVANQLCSIGIRSLRLVSPPDGVPIGWDVADAVAEIKSQVRERDAVVSLVVNAPLQTMTDRSGESKSTANKEAEKPKRKTYHDYLNSIGDIELWHTPTKEAWATVVGDEGSVNYRIEGAEFTTWLDFKCDDQGLGIPGRDNSSKMIDALKARARYKGPMHKTHLRVSGNLTDAVYIDIGSDDGKAIELRPDGFNITDSPIHKFRRVMSMQKLSRPDQNGSIDELWDWVNCQTEDDKMLVLAFITAAIRPQGPYPLLVLSGPPGASKSVTSKIIRSFIDPSAIPLASAPSKLGDFTAILENSWLLVFDNIDKIPAWLSDHLCMVATGSGIRQRQLHTNTGEVLIEGGRPAILNGIGDLTTRPDLANRCVIVNLEPAPIRRAEYLETSNGQALWPLFEKALPRIAGGIYSVFCAAMKHYNDGIDHPTGNPRMVDFAVWGNAVGMAMGWEPGAFDAAYRANRTAADEIALEDSFLWKYLESVFPSGDTKWSGSAEEFKVKTLQAIDPPEQRKRFDSYKNSTIGKELSRIKAILNQKGWQVHFNKTNKHGRTWHITPPGTEK